MTAKKKPSKEQKLLELVKLLEEQNELDFYIHESEQHRSWIYSQVKELKKELKIK